MASELVYKSLAALATMVACGTLAVVSGEVAASGYPTPPPPPPPPPPEVVIKGSRIPKDPITTNPTRSQVEDWALEGQTRRYLEHGHSLLTFSVAAPPNHGNNSKTDTRSNPTTCKPVTIATGEKTLDHTLFTGVGLTPLSVGHSYRSNAPFGSHSFASYSTGLGARWELQINSPRVRFAPTCNVYPGWISMGCLPDWIEFLTPEGNTYTYRVGASGYPLGYNPVNTQGKAIFTGSTVTVHHFGRTYHFNRGNQGPVILSVAENNRVLYTYRYQPVGSRYLESITAANGRQVRFVWDASFRISQTVDPAGQIWSYGYNGSGMLTTVTPPPGTKGALRYHYEDTRDFTLLTGFSVDNVRT